MDEARFQRFKVSEFQGLEVGKIRARGLFDRNVFETLKP